MRLWQRILALLTALCLVGGGAALAQDAAYALIDPIETSAEAQIIVRFRGEAGVTYALHHNYQGVWLQPMEVTLLLTAGQFNVVLGLGKNEFVLNEKGQPRDAQGAVPFAIELLDPSKAEAQVPAPAAQGSPEAPQSPVASQAPAVLPEASAKAAGSESPAAARASEPTPVPEKAQAPEPTQVPEKAQAPDAALAPAVAAEATPEPEAAAPSEPETVDAGQSGDRVLRLWMRGDDVRALQTELSARGFKAGRADGVYGPRTRLAVRRFQRKHELKVDGVVGEKTRAKLAELGVILPPYVAPDLSMPEGFSRHLSFGVMGMDVHRVQERLIGLDYLTGKADQVYGKRTRKAVMAFQLENGLKVDGICGPETLRALFP